MNPGGDTLATTLLALLFSGAQFFQEQFDWQSPEWTLRDGVVVKGEVRDFDWDSKSLILAVDSGGALTRVPAAQLGFWSKLHLLSSGPFHDHLFHHLPELEKNPGFARGLQQLQRLGLILATAYVLLFSTGNWLLAGWLLRSGSILRWLESGAAFVVLAALCAGLVAVCTQQFGAHQMTEYLGLAISLHTVLYIFLVWVIYQAGPLRSALWYFLCWGLALSLPATLGGTVLMAQVQGQTGGLDLASWDRYLTELWLRPMGLL